MKTSHSLAASSSCDCSGTSFSNRGGRSRRSTTFPEAWRLVEAGADPEAVRDLCAAVVSDAVWRMLTLLDEAWTHPLADDLGLPGWILMEVDRKTDKLTGSNLGGIHESISDVDPEDREGHPFFSR